MKNWLVVSALVVLVAVSGCINSSISPENAKALADAHNTFGFKLFGELRGNEPGKNLLISSSSISLALSMVHSGAAGETLAAMEKTLEIQGFNQTAFDRDNRDLMAVLATRDPKVELSIANSIWLNKGFAIKPEYQKNMETYYNARATSLDFGLQSSIDTINSWVADKTRGKITKVLKQAEKDEVAYLINAIYFNGKWTYQFDKKDTTDGTFYGKDKETKIPMMRKFHEYNYFENDEFQAIRLPYGTGTAAMYVFLPKDMDSFLGKMDGSNWTSWLEQMRPMDGTIVLPKFKFEYEKELAEELKALGMGIAFSDFANFSGMSDTSIAISRVIHKTYIDVNEEGTEAAAVTVVGMRTTSVPIPKKPFYMEVNKPFFFGIRDEATGELLFMGVVNNLG